VEGRARLSSFVPGQMSAPAARVQGGGDWPVSDPNSR
jgi:hypothetical protein